MEYFENLNYSPMGDSPLGDSPMGDSPMGEFPMGDSPMGESPMGDSPWGNPPWGNPPWGIPPMGDSPMGASSMGDYITELFWCKMYREILFQTVALGYLLHFVQNGSSKHIFKHILLHNSLNNPKITRPGFHLGAQQKRKVMISFVLYERYRSILFQKDALDYLLHFVQN